MAKKTATPENPELLKMSSEELLLRLRLGVKMQMRVPGKDEWKTLEGEFLEIAIKSAEASSHLVDHYEFRVKPNEPTTTTDVA